MAAEMEDLQTGTVYQIWSPSNPNKVYVGATTQELSARKSGHRRGLKIWLADNTSPYCTSYEVLRFPDARIDWLETVRFSKKSELAAREGHWIRTLDCVNKTVTGRTRAEYRVDNRVEIAAYRADNRDKILAQRAEHYVDNREAILARNAEYRAAHRVERAEYLAAHRVERAARKNVKYNCACGGKYTHGNTLVHARTKMHIAYMAQPT